MEAIFRSHGYTVVGFNCEADIYVINTCVVTNTGQRKSRQMINRAVRRNPTAFVVVTGCYPQTAAEEVKTIPGVDLIIGNQDRADIVRLVEEAAAFQSVDTIDSVRKLSANTEFEELSAGDVSDKTRAFFKKYRKAGNQILLLIVLFLLPADRCVRVVLTRHHGRS